MNIVVTGATSMIGMNLIEKAILNNCRVLAIVRKGTNRMDRLPTSKLVQVIYADLGTLSEVKNQILTYDVFYHLAWEATRKDHRDNSKLQEKNIKYTLDAVELAKRLGCKKFIGAGSQAECGYVDSVIDEDVHCQPVIAYGMAKLAACMLSKKMCEQLGMTHIWGRIFSVYGIHDNDDTMIEYALNHLMKGEDAWFSEATNIWNYLYESDAGALFYYLGVRNVADGIYNIASTESKLLKEYIKEIEDVVKMKGKTYFEATSNSKMLNLNVDVRKIIEATGYIPKVDFKEGIRKVVKNRLLV